MDFKGKVSTDTRSIGRGDVFFALSGERFDGHDFIGEALSKGAETVVYSNEAKAVPFKGMPASFIHAADTLKAYGDWAHDARLKNPVPTAAVTGSSGKTTVKEMLSHVLSARYAVHKNQGTENNLVGVPKTIFAREARHTAMVLELGTNLPGEIARLTAIAAPDIAAITRIGPSHLQGLGSLEGVREEKLSIVRGLKTNGTLWLNGDDPQLAGAKIEGVKIRMTGIENPYADLRAEAIESGAGGQAFKVGGKTFRVACLGRHNILNALIVMGIAREWGLSDAEIEDKLASFQPVAGRLGLRRIDGFTFLDDTYNANPISFEAALQVLADWSGAARRIVAAGDMLELGLESEKFHRALGRRAAEKKIDCLITAGERARAAADEAVRAGMSASSVHACKDSAEAGETLRTLMKAGDVALVKGSRGMKMEKVFECFSPSFTR